MFCVYIYKLRKEEKYVIIVDVRVIVVMRVNTLWFDRGSQRGNADIQTNIYVCV